MVCFEQRAAIDIALLSSPSSGYLPKASDEENSLRLRAIEICDNIMLSRSLSDCPFFSMSIQLDRREQRPCYFLNPPWFSTQQRLQERIDRCGFTLRQPIMPSRPALKDPKTLLG